VQPHAKSSAQNKGKGPASKNKKKLLLAIGIAVVAPKHLTAAWFLQFAS